jgi:hypothetical protein
MKPSIGRIVIFKLHAEHALQINRRRTSGPAIGNAVSEGEEYPMLITRVWSPEAVNGQVFLDSNDVFWATSAHEGTENGQWHWPERV